MAWDFHSLFINHARGIASSLRRRGLSRDLAEDLTQDTFVRVMTSSPGRAKGNYNPKAFLYTVSRNLGINHLKRQALIETVSLDADEAVNLADPAPSPESIVYTRQCLLDAHKALDELPERTRRAFEMHRMGERTLAEIADDMDISTTRAWGLVREAYLHLISRVDAP